MQPNMWAHTHHIWYTTRARCWLVLLAGVITHTQSAHSTQLCKRRAGPGYDVKCRFPSPSPEQAQNLPCASCIHEMVLTRSYGTQQWNGMACWSSFFCFDWKHLVLVFLDREQMESPAGQVSSFLMQCCILIYGDKALQTGEACLLQTPSHGC